MILKDREKKVLNFIGQFKIATTDTISELFYPSLRYAQHRLKQMHEAGHLKRDRDDYTAQYYYYLRKPRQLRHSLLITDFYRELNKVAKIEMFQNEFTLLKGMRPDAFIAYEFQGKKDIAFLEVEISNNGFNIEKYEMAYHGEEYKKYFPIFPTIIAVTNKSIPDTELKIIQVDEDIKNLRDVL